MKIVHISDLHFGYTASGDNCSTKSAILISELIKRCAPAPDYIVVITGDIVDKGRKVEQLNEVKVILDGLTNNRIRYLICPGNHDYGAGNLISEKHQQEFKEIFYGNSFYPFPTHTIIENTVFIGLDSLQGEFDSSDGQFDDNGYRGDRGPDGSLGSRQRDELKKILALPEVVSCRYRVVYLHHHPFYNAFAKISALHDSPALGKILKEADIDLLMFGHKHKGDILGGDHWGIPRIFDGGSSTGKKMEKPTPVRVLDLEKSSDQYQEWEIV